MILSIQTEYTQLIYSTFVNWTKQIAHEDGSGRARYHESGSGNGVFG